MSTDNVIVVDAEPAQKPLLKPPRKWPKTQGEMRIDVQELHLQVLQSEKEKIEIEKGNLLLKRKKLELQIALLERNLHGSPNVMHEPFTAPISPIF